MIGRLGRYVLGSYPPAFYLPYGVSWAVGVTALFALVDPRLTGWRPDVGVVVAALTFAIDLLLMRALDDIRDLDYDREHNPGRPLPSGAVRVGDLAVLIAVGVVVVLALNAGRGIALVALAVQLGYALLVLAADRLLGWPHGDDVVTGLLVSFPVQILINLYLYAGVLHQTGLGPGWHAVPALLTAATAYLHLEFARKVTRDLRPGERSYVTVWGAERTAVISTVSAVVSVAVALAFVRPWESSPWGWLVVLPLGFVVSGADAFWRRRAVRWPVLPPALFLLSSFVLYLVVALLGKDTG
ncbi:UbiA family prenyltransferase [Streptosporangium jomthongense]|uniref:UbiA family prenyltransferase n=1 Tax=Streptosporangium jomthongense TaxID=1193683 RepID=A0ABV8EZI3_9ACTN